MKKIIAIGTFVFGVFAFAQAQSTTSTPAPAPKNTQNPPKEAPKPAGTTNNDAAGLRVQNRPSTTTTDANAQGGDSQLQPSNTPPTTRVINNSNRVNVNGAAPVQTQPVVKPTTPRN